MSLRKNWLKRLIKRNARGFDPTDFFIIYRYFEHKPLTGVFREILIEYKISQAVGNVPATVLLHLLYDVRMMPNHKRRSGIDRFMRDTFLPIIVFRTVFIAPMK